ncbi:MAG TPA: type VI secretion system tip protein VgrG, partial [Candidatus Nanopelagicales bacterium]|nr:type VI secretion system tip protein VgrG [Candidatus Nanopelagicales bacterium]
AIATIRAERIQCERRTYTARTDCSRFRVGHRFELENHHDASHDGQYLITGVEHRVGYPVRSVGALAAAGTNMAPLVHSEAEDLGDAPQRYLARFEAIPYGVPFRPERRTPWPRIHGIMHGHVDADTAGDYAQIDGHGRYKVKLPFDSSGRKGTKASRWMRLAQPYAGAGYGSHFPLHKGTEVLIAHIDGDPDRPIIVGAVPNPQTASPSTAANATQSVVQTASGIRMEMEDLQG